MPIDILGYSIPLWLFFAGALVALVVIWKFIKFAIKLLIVLVVFVVLLIGLDILGVFAFIQDTLFMI